MTVKKSSLGAFCPWCSQEVPYGRTLPAHKDGACIAKTAKSAGDVRRQAVIAALEKQAGQWEKQALDGRWTLAEEVRCYLVSKAASARSAAARLKGEDAPEQEPKVVTKTVVVSR
jgi:hypothetical protein